MTDTDTTARYAAFVDPDRAGPGGNPAGVVLEAGHLDDVARQRVAAQVGYSETAFLEATDEDRRFRTRYFSPLAEVAFCGHATIAACVALAERIGPGQLVLDTLAGRIDVATAITPRGIAATLTSVPTHSRRARADELAQALQALRWQPEDLDPRYPPHVAFAGNDHLVLAARTRQRLGDLDYDFEGLGGLMARQGWTTVHLVHAGSPTSFSARDPFPPGGVVEDPATGAAAAAFGGYLRALGLVDLPATVTIEQGADMGSPSLLELHIDAESPSVRVTGYAVPIA